MAADHSIKNHVAEKRMFFMRVMAACLLLLLLAGLLASRIVYLQLYKHDYYQTRSQDNQMRNEVISPVRGLIYDRNGELLATNKPTYRLEITPEQVPGDLKTTLYRLAQIVDIDDEDKKRFYKQKKLTPGFRSTPILMSLSEEEIARFEVNRDRFPGVRIKAGLTREYPYSYYTAPVVGYVSSLTREDLDKVDRKRYQGASRIGKMGVERFYESMLHGRPGARQMETNAAGRTLRELGIIPAVPGSDLELSIDSKLQKYAYNALGDYNGAVVAMDPRNGEVLALVNNPSFDTNLFVDGISHDDYTRLLNNSNRPLYSRSLQGQYPPASTFKPFVALAALENDAIDPVKKVYCPGYITLPGSNHRYRDWKRSGHGWLNLRQGIERSSDVYFYKLSLNLGIDNIHRYGRMFGFGNKTDIDLTGEMSGVMPSRDWKQANRHLPWYHGDTLITAIGQGFVSATPLQLAQATSIIAQRGKAFKPHVLKSWTDPDSGKTKHYKPQELPGIKLKDKRHWDRIIDGMQSVINSPFGTAHLHVGQDLKYPIAGKSGSAQVAGLPQSGHQSDAHDVPRHLRDHALFIAFAPVDKPRIAVAVIVEHGVGGSSVAGPIARNVIDRYLDSLQDKDQDRHDSGEGT